MLNEQEYAEALRLCNECVTGIKEFRKRWQVPLESVGVREPFEILHHRLARFGAACRVCGKPARTPRARLCAACGARLA
jgi:hypothetical protein